MPCFWFKCHLYSSNMTHTYHHTTPPLPHLPLHKTGQTVEVFVPGLTSFETVWLAPPTFLCCDMAFSLSSLLGFSPSPAGIPSPSPFSLHASTTLAFLSLYSDNDTCTHDMWHGLHSTLVLKTCVCLRQHEQAFPTLSGHGCKRFKTGISRLTFTYSVSVSLHPLPPLFLCFEDSNMRHAGRLGRQAWLLTQLLFSPLPTTILYYSPLLSLSYLLLCPLPSLLLFLCGMTFPYWTVLTGDMT